MRCCCPAADFSSSLLASEPVPSGAGSFGVVYLAFDPDNNLLLADTYNHRIRKILPNGIITTVVGNGTEGFGGDGGLATSAQHAQQAGLLNAQNRTSVSLANQQADSPLKAAAASDVEMLDGRLRQEVRLENVTVDAGTTAILVRLVG